MNVSNTHHPSAQLKPIPVFRADHLGTFKQFLNLIWLLRLVLKVAPSPALLWAFTSLVRSLVLPINLWITKYLVDAVVDAVRADGSLSPVFTYLTFLLAGLFIQRLVGWIDPMVERQIPTDRGQGTDPPRHRQSPSPLIRTLRAHGLLRRTHARHVSNRTKRT